ncbi:sensor histidine kinase [Streptacidiphilus rugosus]|uniref:sensor histidine kinase n=1 Tax=Streptacidiphilus rugosus TaxID=405783 RepID=UPI000AB92C23|nr:histidine kinase [Streptacidiphilus rugosus]
MWGTEDAALTAALAATVAVAGWLALALRRQRRSHRATLGERGWLLERERAIAAQSAVEAERARIARELHDIVSHNVSLMVVSATAAREVLTTMPDEAATALQAVEGAGRTTMTELRHLLGLLAPAQDGSEADAEPEAATGFGPGSQIGSGAGASSAGLEPQPGMDRLGSLVDRISFAGLPVEVRVLGEPRPLPAGVDVTAYRIVQEALTNALRHGDGGKAEVTVRYADHSLRVEVLNTGSSVLSGGAPPPRPTRGAGRGLIGLRERVAVYGGDLDARRRLGGGYRVRARIPLERP